jgi:hypothetical protein
MVITRRINGFLRLLGRRLGGKSRSNLRPDAIAGRARLRCATGKTHTTGAPVGLPTSPERDSRRRGDVRATLRSGHLGWR